MRSANETKETRLADIVILDRDPRGVRPEQLSNVTVERTWVGGSLGYARDGEG